MIRTYILALCILGLSCNSTLRIKDGKMAYDYKKYALAIEMLKEELKKSYDTDKHFLLASAYAKIDMTDEALETYGEAIGSETSAERLLDYAYVLKKAERYDKAIRVFQMLKTESNLDVLLDREIAACQDAERWSSSPDSLTIIEIMKFNSPQSDYAPSIVNRRLLFTSDRDTEDDEEIYEWTGAAYSDIWEVALGGEDPTPLAGKFNTEHNEGTPVMTSDGNEMFFTRCYSDSREDAFCHIMQVKRQNGGWSKVKPVEELKGNFNVMHPTLTQDGQLMFFASDASGGIGGMDLYFTRKTSDGWERPRNLGQIVNGEGDEVFPFIYQDTLYFASSSHPGMGGLDIFYTYFGPDNNWVRPINIQAPINSGSDDFGFFRDTVISDKGIKMKGFFSSSRSEGMGRDDIYGFTTYYPQDTVEEEKEPLILTIKVVKPIYRLAGEPNSGIRRYVPVKGARVTVNEESYTTDVTGVLTQKIDSSDFFRISASAPDLLSSSTQFSAQDDLEEGLGYVRLVLTPIFYNTEIVIRNIYYDFNKWDIRPDARPPLDSLVNILKDNPDIRIQLASHTDCRGELEFNQELSEKRAASALQYLIANGISPDRLESVGYGETRPFINCECARCTEEEHQTNRRTTFKILK
ncbi:MAG: OmpA family protein [Saprospiraceae bacterium]|nr:OmpA family protein [Saprospiraceae bacterium]